MVDANQELSIFNAVNALRSRSARQEYDQKMIRVRLDQLLKSYGERALEVAQGFLSRSDVKVSQHFRNAVLELVQD